MIIRLFGLALGMFFLVGNLLAFNPADVRAAKTGEKHLVGMDLSNARLKSINLSEAVLSSVNFRKANLQNAIFVNANLTGANLLKANLSSADFKGSILIGSKLKGANFNNAKNMSMEQKQYAREQGAVNVPD